MLFVLLRQAPQFLLEVKYQIICKQAQFEPTDCFEWLHKYLLSVLPSKVYLLFQKSTVS